MEPIVQNAGALTLPLRCISVISVLPVVIYITNGTISDWENPLNNSFRGSLDLAPVTLLII